MSLVDAFADFVGSVPSRWVELAWGRAHVWDLGEGPPVVMLHGIAGSRRILHRVAPLLAGRRRVVVAPLRGEDIAWPGLGWEDLLDDVGALLGELDLEGVTLFGASFGGALALAYGGRRDPRVAAVAVQGTFARYRLELLDRLTLAASYLAPPGLSSRYFAYRILHGEENRFLAEHAPGLDVLNADWCRKTPFATVRGRIHLIARRDLSAAVRRIDVPLTLSHGRLDTVVPFASFEHLRRLRPDARAVAWDDTGHMVPLTHPERIASLIAP